MIAKIYSAIPTGYTGSLVEVEGGTMRSLPSFNIVGMANKTVSEARERVRTAILNSNLIFPSKKVTINLAPADLIKTGTHLDLPIALTVALLAEQLLPSDVEDKLFVGELSLDGHLKPVRGIINIVEAARDAGFKEVYLPRANLRQASLISGISLVGVDTLSETILHLRGFLPQNSTKSPQSLANLEQTSIVVKNTKTDVNREKSPTSQPQPQDVVKNTKTDNSLYLLDHIRGQIFAKRALEIAIAGQHNILLYGPPGTGKTLLARTAANLLPPLSREEQISLTKIHSLSGLSDDIVSERPFRSPHHTASSTAIIGGGANAQPGEISLAEHGILFLDELPEFSRPVLESLRQPLESHEVTIARTNSRNTFPANFMLIAAMNPCPCGYLGDSDHTCRCTPQALASYRKKISGPIFDRIDIIVHVEKTAADDLITLPSKTSSTEHNVVKNNIIDCRKLQAARYGSSRLCNSRLTTSEINKYITLDPSIQQFLSTAVKNLNLSTRSYYKVLRVSRTIADLEHSTNIKITHISEALALRGQIY